MKAMQRESDARRQSVSWWYYSPSRDSTHGRPLFPSYSLPPPSGSFAECERKMARMTRGINAFCFSSNAAFNRALSRNPRVHLPFFSSFLRREGEGELVLRYMHSSSDSIAMNGSKSKRGCNVVDNKFRSIIRIIV